MDLGHEIAQRLQCSPETAAALLEEIVRDIRRKTAQGETARLRHIGAFEARGAELVFEPDAGLAEIVNAPFAGLPAIPLADPGPIRRKTDEVLQDERPGPTRGDLPSARRQTLRTRARSRARAGWIIGIGLAIVAAGAWLLLADRMENPGAQSEPPSASATSAPAPQETPASSLQGTAPPSTALSPAETDQPASEANERIAADTLADAAETANPLAARPYADAPLRGAEPIDRARGGYTIVVASETNEQRAQGWAEGWRKQGFRTTVLPYAQDGVTLYRVGVGQFALLEEAARVRDALMGNELPRGAWVLRI